MRRLTTTIAITTTLLWAGVAAADEGDEEGEGEGEEEEIGEGEEEVPVPEEGGGGGETDPVTAPGGAMTVDTYPQAYVDRPTTLPAGVLEIQGEVGINLSKELVAYPITIHPDVYYGVNADLTLGLTHARGFCLNGEKDFGGGVIIDLCGGKVYNDIGVDALYKIHRKGKLDVAAHGGLDVAAFDPFVMALRAGVSGEYLANPKIGIFFDPYLVVGITERDAGNKEAINIPVWAAYQVTPTLAAWVRTGIGGYFESFGDNYGVPLALGALFSLNQTMDVGGEFIFPRIAGGAPEGSENPGADLREIQLFFNYRM